MLLDELARAARAIAQDVGPSVVGLGDRHEPGNAIVIADGRLIASAHGVDEGGVAVHSGGDAPLRARVVGLDHDLDLAVLEANGVGPALGISPEPAVVGSPVFAVAAGPTGARVTFGLVSLVGLPLRSPRGRRIDGLIEHTAHLAPGSSGSALVDAEGRLVGMNTRRLGRGFYTAIPVDEALMERIEGLVSRRVTEPPRLGVTIAPSWIAQQLRTSVGLSPRDGLLVREVEPDSAASQAGMLVGDLLLAVDGRELDDPGDLADAIDASSGSMTIALLRGETELTVSVQPRGG
jgi:S1-C subfamily serine protease